ncbi:Histone deacetylase hda1, partial [Mortierella sp. AD011]
MAPASPDVTEPVTAAATTRITAGSIPTASSSSSTPTTPQTGTPTTANTAKAFSTISINSDPSPRDNNSDDNNSNGHDHDHDHRGDSIRQVPECHRDNDERSSSLALVRDNGVTQAQSGTSEIANGGALSSSMQSLNQEDPPATPPPPNSTNRFAAIELPPTTIPTTSTTAEMTTAAEVASATAADTTEPMESTNEEIKNQGDASSAQGIDQENNHTTANNNNTQDENNDSDKDSASDNDIDNEGDASEPSWSDHENEPEGPLLPQPDSFHGRSTKTGYVYDVRMKHHNNVHGDDDHPEDPRRIWRIFDALVEAKISKRMIKIPSREATFEELNLVHTDDHIDNITKTSEMNKDELFEMANSYNSIYLNNLSAFCARLSCGSLIELCKAVATGQVLNGLAIIRPPGHHAEPHEAGGFCLYNNVAIAARYLQKAHGLRKIFILDWDVHHGNGTQTVFYDDPDVVYCSIHRFDHGEFYPGDPVAAAHTAVGEGPGRGRTINIPWNVCGMGDAEYIYAFNKVIMPIVFEFAPDFVLVSAGFDAAKGDHIGQMLVTPPAYGHMTHMLKALAGGKVILALEGGYNLDSIAVSGLACAKALLNDPIEPLGPITPNPECVQTIHEVIEVQSRYWKSLPQVYIDSVEEPVKGRLDIGMNKVLGVYREEYLRERYDMIKMPRLESDREMEFLENVYCTGEFRARKLGINNILRPEKSCLMDSVSHYVDHIIGSENELIDIVQPYQPTSEEEKVSMKDKLSALLAEIWDNYVSTTGYTGRKIVLLGTGFGCHGMVSFMNERQKEVAKYVSCVTLVPGDDSLPMVTKKLGPWYMENSFVILTNDHPIWERAQKPNNRNGNIIRSENLPPVNADDSDLDFKDEPEPMETDSTPTPTPIQQNGKLSSQNNGDVKPNNLSLSVEDQKPTRSPRISQQRPISPLPVKTEEPLKVEGSIKMEKPTKMEKPRKMEEPVKMDARMEGRMETKIEEPVRIEEPPQNQATRSYPGSPHISGSSIQRPISQPLVDRPSVVGQQHRPQPYPTPNGRSYNSPVMNSSSGSLPIYPRGSTPQGRGSDVKLAGESMEPKPRSIPISEQQYQQQYLEEQRHMDMQRQHQQQQQQQQEHYQPHPRHPQERPDVRGGHPYPYQGSGAGEKRIPRSSGPGEFYPTPATS